MSLSFDLSCSGKVCSLLFSKFKPSRRSLHKVRFAETFVEPFLNQYIETNVKPQHSSQGWVAKPIKTQTRVGFLILYQIQLTCPNFLALPRLIRQKMNL